MIYWYYLIKRMAKIGKHINTESNHNSVDINGLYINVIHIKSIGIIVDIHGVYMNMIYLELIDNHTIMESILVI